MRGFLWLACGVAIAGLGSAGAATIEEAVQAMQRGDLAAAEQILRSHPKEPEALGVLGVVLDQEKKYDEAENAYRQALALTPRSAGLLNNYGNHLLATGKPKAAEPVFVKVLAIDPGHVNALVQLARMALEQRKPTEALKYLARVPDQAAPAFLLRMQAMYELHRDQEAGGWLARAAERSSDTELGVALASVKQYAKATDYFERALQKAPGDFTAKYQLGLAASHAGKLERAGEVLELARQQQPENVDVLFDLAVVETQSGAEEQALALLARGAKLAPERADIWRLLARTAGDLGYFGDAVEAWDRVTKLAPRDEEARRERGFAQTAAGEELARGMAELRGFVGKYPNDAMGHYELGTAEAASDPAQALAEVNRALVLNPDLVAAHIARGTLKYRDGDFAAALPDFLFAAKRDTKNAAVLDRVGETELALGRSGEAEAVLRDAAAVAPRNSRILLHLGRALTANGKSAEAAATLARFRELGADKSTLPHAAGLVDFLGLSPEEQRARYRAGLERTVAAHPENAEALTHYMELLLEGGERGKAGEMAQAIGRLKPSGALLAEAAGALNAAGQYASTEALIKEAGDPASLAVDSAIAVWHTRGAAAGLEATDRVPHSSQDGDVHLLRGVLLRAAGRGAEASAELEAGLAAHPTRPYLIGWGALALLREHRTAQAMTLLQAGIKQYPENPELFLLRAVALNFSPKPADAKAALSQIANRWPDWSEVYRAEALVFESQGDLEGAWRAAEFAIGLAPQNVRIRTVAERIASARKDSEGTREQDKARSYILSAKSQSEPAEDTDDIESLFR